jgi:hypothetical protein
MIDKADFEIWLANSVTQHVFGILASKADEAKSKWLTASWGNGEASPLLLVDLRARAELLIDIVELEFEDIEEDDEPERNTPD